MQSAGLKLRAQVSLPGSCLIFLIIIKPSSFVIGSGSSRGTLREESTSISSCSCEMYNNINLTGIHSTFPTSGSATLELVSAPDSCSSNSFAKCFSAMDITLPQIAKSPSRPTAVATMLMPSGPAVSGPTPSSRPALPRETLLW